MKPLSYSFWATCMVALAPKPSLRPASCWRVVVREGPEGAPRPGLRPPHPAAQARRGQGLPPQQGRDLVAVEAVEDAPGLLGVDEALVELARIGDGLADRVPGDLVEDHAAARDLGLEHLLQVPGDGLALAVLVRGQV